MAVIQGSAGSDYEKHPEGGRYRGYIREVVKLEDKISTFPDNNGGTREVPTVPRMLIVENCDGQQQYTHTAEDGTETVRNHDCSSYFAIYDGRFGPKTNVGKLYKLVLGAEATTSPFDDEQVIGKYVLYMCEHSEGGEYANAVSIKADPDQSPPPEALGITVKTYTQADRASGSIGGDGATEPAVIPNSAGEQETYRRACDVWIKHNGEQGVWDSAKIASYNTWLLNGKLVDMKRFVVTAATDCADANKPAPQPDPLDDDLLPF